MYTEFAVSKNLVPSASLSLKSVWILESDPSYDVRIGGLNNCRLIAIRTVKGIGRVTLKEIGDIDISEGTLFITERKRIERYYCASTNWDFWWFEFLITDAFFNLPKNRIMEVSILESERERVFSCCNMLQEEDTLSKSIASSSFTVLLYQWLREYNNTIIPLSKPYAEQLSTVVSFMKSNLSSRITMEDMAQKVGLCEKRFRQLFQNIYGVAPKKYFDQLRMQSAEALLKNTNLSLSSIAERLGYSNQFHFSREFKKQYNLVPSKFRNRDGD